jgi:hypothetical protein
MNRSQHSDVADEGESVTLRRGDGEHGTEAVGEEVRGVKGENNDALKPGER